MAQPAGYSGKALWQKLGLADGQRLLLVNAPRDIDDLLAGAPVMSRLPRLAEFEVAIAFFVRRGELQLSLAKLLSRLAQGGMIWIAWPKKTSGVATDITENVVRDVALPTGLVDVKVCAIDATWSGLKLLRRRA